MQHIKTKKASGWCAGSLLLIVLDGYLTMKVLRPVCPLAFSTIIT